MLSMQSRSPLLKSGKEVDKTILPKPTIPPVTPLPNPTNSDILEHTPSDNQEASQVVEPNASISPISPIPHLTLKG